MSTMKKWLKRTIRNPMRRGLKGIFLPARDRLDRALKRSDPKIPPRALLKVKAEDYEIVGDEFINLLLEHGNLQADGRVLDVGCGTGRMASALTTTLSPKGEYWGFDILDDAIGWCETQIAQKHGNFHFLHGDVYNRQYNPKGKVPAEEYKFPFEDGSFDLVFLVSVLPHMRLAEVENYISEIGRMLKAGGTWAGTFFLYNKEVQESLHLEHPGLDFVRGGEKALMTREQAFGGTIALEERYLGELQAYHGMEISRILRGGTWADRKTYLSAQDIVFATKKEAGR